MTETTSPSAGADAREPVNMTHRQIMVVLSGLMLGMLLAALDQTIVSTALYRITTDLGGAQHLQWVVTAYLLTSTASTPLYGKISDLYGRKIVFQFAIVVFIIGSALAGASQNMLELILTRAFQGIGAGGLITLALAIIGDVVSPRERGRYQGYFGAVWGLSSVAGPLLGGFFTQDLSWRWVFYINLPVGIVALVVTSAVLNIPFHRRDHKVDYLGSALLVAGSSALLLALSLGGKAHNGGFAWGAAPIVALFVVGAVLTVAFVVWEGHAPEPILPLRLFRNKVFSLANVIGFILGFTMFGAIIFVPVYLQAVKNVSPTMSGLEMLPLMVGVLATSIGSGRAISKMGRYKIFPIVGTILITLGFGLMSLITATTPFWQLAGDMLLLGGGMGLVMQVLIIAIQNSVDYADLGVGTSSNTFFRSMGGSIGVAAFGAMVTNMVTGYVVSHVPAGPTLTKVKAALDGGQSGGAQQKLGGPLKDIFNHAYVHAIDATFRWTVPLAIVAAVLALVLPEKRLRTTSGLGGTTPTTSAAETEGASLAPVFE